ncbi:MAG TPA: hypothetical protein VKX39_19160 [Bryobacteraceae bacterium]|jgi:hypothetical protein|nr:hypothetical protein [Bryobacteraceae bacterium]
MNPNDSDLPRHRRIWASYNRPYSGCGCLWTIIIILIIWWILSWIFGWGWGWGWGGTGGGVTR